MIDIIADLHLHSKYSRAVSPQMTLPVMAQVAEQKGIELLATGDWTHPLWFREIRNQLEESESGLYRLKTQPTRNKLQINPNVILKSLKNDTRTNPSTPLREEKEVRFLLSVEISTIYSQGGKGRRIHHLVFVPSFETAEKVNKELMKRGCNLSADGRPIIGLSSKNLLSLLLEIDERSLLIPAHIWTPWFGIYGQMSGFNSLEEAFEDMAPFVYGIETGLSSDPEMNWQMKELETRSILSFSDAHSPAKMGREATVFQLENLSYENIRQAIMAPSRVHGSQLIAHGKEVQTTMNDEQLTMNKVLYTIEFYPEEGKYHYSGHRNCNISQTPEEQQATNGICPVCKRKVTDGVVRRVKELSQEDVRGLHKPNSHKVVWITDPKGIHPPFVKIVPLNEIIAEAIGRPVSSPKVKLIFDTLVEKFGNEFEILLKVSGEDIRKGTREKPFDFAQGQRIAEGVEKVRQEAIVIKPGFDGVYGIVKIWNDEEGTSKKTQEETLQPLLDL